MKLLFFKRKRYFMSFRPDEAPLVANVVEKSQTTKHNLTLGYSFLVWDLSMRPPNSGLSRDDKKYSLLFYLFHTTGVIVCFFFWELTTTSAGSNNDPEEIKQQYSQISNHKHQPRLVSRSSPSVGWRGWTTIPKGSKNNIAKVLIININPNLSAEALRA